MRACPKSETPPHANVIRSNVIYKRELDGLPKVRIVPWGHWDVEKSDICGRAPSLSLDLMGLVLSFAVENGWEKWKMDDNCKGFSSDIYVHPPSEEKDNDGL